MTSHIRPGKTCFRFLQYILLFLALFCLFENQTYAGDIAVEIGRGNGVRPKGGYVEGLNSIDGPFPYQSAKFSLKYTFDWGLVLGRELFGSYFEISDGSDASYLMARIDSYTIGWAFGDSYRIIVEAGLPQKGKVTTSKNSLDFFGLDSVNSQKVDAHWVGVTTDFGFKKGDSSGFGAAIYLRQVAMSTNDLFNSGKSFDAGGLYFGGALRYRF